MTVWFFLFTLAAPPHETHVEWATSKADCQRLNDLVSRAMFIAPEGLSTAEAGPCRAVTFPKASS